MTHRLTLAQLFVLALAGCAPNAAAAPTDLDLCAQFGEVAGHEVTVPLHLDAARVELGEALMNGGGDPPCPEYGHWWFAIDCADRVIAFAPGGFVGLTEVEPAVTRNFICVGGSNGTLTDAAACVPSGCGGRLPEVERLSRVRSARGVLQTTPRTEPSVDGRPLYLFGVEELELIPYDAAEDCDPTVPRIGCPCDGPPRTLCPYLGLECQSGVWISFPDICGIG